MAGVTALAVTGGVAGYMLTGDDSGAGTAAGPTASASGAASPRARTDPQVCAMIDGADAERLVPEAEISSDVQDNRRSTPAYVTWSCTWQNLDISRGEFTRARTIEVKVTQQEAEGHRTAEAVGRDSYGSELRSFQYRVKRPVKDYHYSSVVRLAGVGDEAHSQYIWSRKEGGGHSYGEGVARVGNVIIKVRFEGSQQRKDAPILSGETKRSVTEQNALRETRLLLDQAAGSVAAWHQGRPYARATPAESAEPTPTASGTPEPEPITLPKVCARTGLVNSRLVPDPDIKATRTIDGGRSIVTCRWLNRRIPAGSGGLRTRSVLITLTLFSDRAGAVDPVAAKEHYIDLRAKAKKWEGSGFQGIFWYRLAEPKGVGDRAYYQYRANRTGTAHAGLGEAAVLTGPFVVEVAFGGADRPAKAPINSAKSTLMPQREAIDGVTAATEAFVDALKQSGTI